MLTGCGPEQVDLTGKTMGTSYSIRYVTGDDTPSAREMQAEIDKRLEQVNDQMSTYRPDSELSRFNASRDIDRPFPVSPATAEVVREALRINRVTDGALDVTVGPLVNCGASARKGGRIKCRARAGAPSRRTGADKLAVQGSALVKSIPELYVDLSSIASDTAWTWWRSTCNRNTCKTTWWISAVKSALAGATASKSRGASPSSARPPVRSSRRSW